MKNETSPIRLSEDQRAEMERIDKSFEAAKSICRVLVPHSERARRRILAYFLDLVSDQDGEIKEAEILRQVTEMLRAGGIQ